MTIHGVQHREDIKFMSTECLSGVKVTHGYAKCLSYKMMSTGNNSLANILLVLLKINECVL